MDPSLLDVYLVSAWIREIHPLLWRRFLVRADSTLAVAVFSATGHRHVITQPSVPDAIGPRTWRRPWLCEVCPAVGPGPHVCP